MFIIKRYLFIISITTTLLLVGCDSGPQYGNKTRAKTIQSTHYRNILEIYNSFSYRWNAFDNGVPPLLLHRFPTDIHLIRPTRHKKAFFFQSLLPMVLLGNAEIQQQRNAVENILKLHDNGRKLAIQQHEELIKIQQYYKVKGDLLEDETIRVNLMTRIDTIPTALALAQAANESGWGMSRFAQHANNIFGEWTFTPGTGIVPEGRPVGATYEVRRFKNLYASIKSYLRNLNTHSAYRSMRNTRLRLRKNGLPATGYTLAGDMQYYSTRRGAYVDEIRAIIVSNRLEELNLVTLLPEAKPQKIEEELHDNSLLSTREKTSRKSKM